MSNSDDLKHLLVNHSVKRGNFILASGRESTMYIDARLTTMHPDGMRLIGQLGLERILSQGWSPDSIGGLTMGADPIAVAISFTSSTTDRALRAFTVRKEPKEHGTGNRIEGPFRNTDRVVIVEDVITTGQSAIKAIDAVEAAGASILGVLALVDREEGGRDAIQSRGHQVLSLMTISDLAL